MINAQKQVVGAEQEAAKAYEQIDKLKKKHEKEIGSLNELVAKAHLLQKESVSVVHSSISSRGVMQIPYLATSLVLHIDPLGWAYKQKVTPTRGLEELVRHYRIRYDKLSC